MKATPGVKLKSVYRCFNEAAPLLYRLLQERSPLVNISHKKLPTWKQHMKFITSHPYKAWYLVCTGHEVLGAIYLSHNNEIGLFILKKYQQKSYGKKALSLLMRKHHAAGRFLANINPKNKPSIRFFEQNGFYHIQNTYERLFTKKGRRI